MKTSKEGLKEGFSLPELLALLAALALLGILQFSALGHQRAGANQTNCADNLRQLAMAWQMYAHDHDGRLAPNRASATTNDWVRGWLNFDPSNSVNTNLATITESRLYPYSRFVGIYRCPDDLSSVAGHLRIRSYSMNSWVGTAAPGWMMSGSGFQIQERLSQIRQPGQTFVFTEEHPGGINDPNMVVDMAGSGDSLRIVDFPSSLHFEGANFSFADGSVRHQRWTDPRTVPPVTFGQAISLNLPSPNNPDAAWLQSVTTYRR